MIEFKPKQHHHHARHRTKIKKSNGRPSKNLFAKAENRTISMYNKSKMDPDIPVAYATDVQVMAPPRGGDPLQELSKGRSHRLVVPQEQGLKMLADHHMRTLQDQGFTRGMINAISRNNINFPLRIWVVDNSGSMSTGDGNRLIETKSTQHVKLVSCSRWTELVETVDYHCQMAALFEIPTAFRLLNDPGKMAGEQQFSIGERGPELIQEDLHTARSTMRSAQPQGVTPLAKHIFEIRENITQMRAELMATGRKVVVVLATDGLPTDAFGYSGEPARVEFENALRSLEGLPVWIVIRLCTDEDSVVDYYNTLDSNLELSLEVLDDFISEAKEVVEHNTWLNYGLPLHRIREMGFSHRLFDLLDERKLSVDELRDFMFLLFGEEHFDGIPDPQVDWKGFCDTMSVVVHSEKKQWNPMTKKMDYWVDMKKLKKAYSQGGCSIM
jgi:hypothetical protein